MEIRRVRTSDPEYPFAEALLLSAFPSEEHREVTEQRDNTDNHPLFHNNVVCQENAPIGIISYWKFDGFCYIEHFAISPTLRNGGYGRQVLEQLYRLVQLPIVLEAELPDNDLSRRRIAFYQREGYQVISETYRQPPYRTQDGPLPMYLMAKDPEAKLTDVDAIVRAIYRHVYDTAAPGI